MKKNYLLFLLKVSDFTRLSIKVTEYARLKKNYLGVSLDGRLGIDVNVLVFTTI